MSDRCGECYRLVQRKMGFSRLIVISMLELRKAIAYTVVDDLHLDLDLDIAIKKTLFMILCPTYSISYRINLNFLDRTRVFNFSPS